MKELSAPLSPEGIDPIHDFLTEGLTRQGCSTALRLRLLTALEELFYAALLLSQGRGGQTRCVLNGPGSVLLSFYSSQGPILPDPEELHSLLCWLEPLSLHRSDSTYIFTIHPNS